MMARSRSITLCVLLAGSSAALGGVEVILSPQTAGPYSPGETVAVDVLLSQVPAGDPHLLRLVQLDFTASDAGLSIVLPTIHAAAGVSFWDFSTVPDCIALDANCGAGHFIDDELPGAFPPGPDVISITYVGDLSDPNDPDLNESFNRQWLLVADGTAEKIGELRVTLPTVAGLPTSCPLDVLNAGEVDVAFGARIDFGFGEDGRTTWRASANEITGGTLDLCASVQVDANLLASDPACGKTLPRARSNFIFLDFDEDIPAAPNPGDVTIEELLAGGGTGADVGGSFAMTIEGGDPRRLRIQEPAGVDTVLTNRVYYRVTNVSWAGVSPFTIDLPVQIGDPSNDGRTTSADVSQINGLLCIRDCPEDSRHDINGDTRITSADVSFTNGNLAGGILLVPQPSGHTICGP